jgi:hypothetical protein
MFTMFKKLFDPILIANEEIPHEIVKKAKAKLSKELFFKDANIISMGSGQTYIEVGVREIGKSVISNHFEYRCPDTGKVYAVPVHIHKAEPGHPQNRGPQ